MKKTLSHNFQKLQGQKLQGKKLSRWLLVFVLLFYIFLSGKNYYTKELSTQTLEDNVIYLYDNMEKSLVPVEIDLNWISQFDTAGILALNIMGKLAIDDQDKSLYATMPKEIKIRTIRVDQKHVIINFDESIFTLSPQQELIFKASLIKSLTSFEAFESVEFFFNGVPMKDKQQKITGKYQTGDVLTTYDDVVNRNFNKTVIIFYPNEKQDKLKQVYQNIILSPNKKIEEVIIETIINEQMLPTLPRDTKLLNVYTNQEVCYVDLSSECQTNYLPNGITERISIYSLVNSLTDLPNITYVQILVEGQIVKTLQGNLSLNRLLTKNYALIELNNSNE